MVGKRDRNVRHEILSVEGRNGENKGMKSESEV